MLGLMMWAASGWPGGWVFPFWCGLLLVGRLEGVGGLCACGEATVHDGQGRQDRDHLTDRTTSGHKMICKLRPTLPRFKSPMGYLPLASRTNTGSGRSTHKKPPRQALHIGGGGGFVRLLSNQYQFDDWE